MMWWVFIDQNAAIAAEQAARATLPPDILTTGQVAPVQITDAWANITTLTDGTFAFPGKPGMTLPSGAAAVADVSALLPAPVVAP